VAAGWEVEYTWLVAQEGDIFEVALWQVADTSVAVADTSQVGVNTPFGGQAQGVGILREV